MSQEGGGDGTEQGNGNPNLEGEGKWVLNHPLTFKLDIEI